MKPQTSDPLPQRVQELVDSVKDTLANLPDEPDARAAAVVKVNADLDEIRTFIQKAPKPKVPWLVSMVLMELGKLAMRGILDILLRFRTRLSRRWSYNQVVWS